MISKARHAAALLLLVWQVDGMASELAQIRATMEAGQYRQAEIQLSERLSQNPADNEARFLYAQGLSWQKKYSESASQYLILTASEPDNADFLLGLAQVHVWSGYPQKALPYLEHATHVAPNYADIWRLRIQALTMLHDEASQTQAIELQQQARNKFPELSWHIVGDAIPSATPHTMLDTDKVLPDEIDRRYTREYTNQIELGYSHYYLRGGQKGWNGKYISGEHKFAPREILYGSISEDRRYGMVDNQIQAGFYYPLERLWTLNVEGNFSPSNHFLAKSSLGATLQREFGKGWNITGGLRQTEYNRASATQGTLMVERYISDYRLAYTLIPTHVDNTMTYAHRFQLGWYYRDTSHISLTGGWGEDIDHSGQQRFLLDTHNVGLNGRHWFNSEWALVWEAGYSKQDNAYTKSGVQLGIRRAF